MATNSHQPDCSLVGQKVQIRPLRFVDLPELAAWEPHTDPLLRSYNLHFDSPSGWHRWLQDRLQSRWVYAIRNLDGELVGHLSLRQINHPCSARLGITVAAEWVGYGYGRDTMGLFLDYFFGKLGFEEMRLDVSGANLRACDLYQKLGFERMHSFWLYAPYAIDRMLLQDEQLCRHFRRGKERFYEMRLGARQWWQVRQARR